MENREKAKYIWMVDSEISSSDIRRYAHSHAEAIAIMKKPIPNNWHLYKLVKVNKRRVPNHPARKRLALVMGDTTISHHLLNKE